MTEHAPSDTHVSLDCSFGNHDTCDDDPDCNGAWCPVEDIPVACLCDCHDHGEFAVL